MLPKSDLARLEFSFLMIEDVELIIRRHENIDNSLNDKEGYHALMMCLMQIGESLSKIKDERLKNLLPVNFAYRMRNIIAHDYLGINLNIIKETLKNDIPQLKKIIIELIETNNSQ